MNTLNFLRLTKAPSIQTLLLSLTLIMVSSLEVSADRTFNIQIKSSSNLSDSLHISDNLSENLLNVVFEKESEEIIAVNYQVFDVNDRLLFTGSESEWLNSNDPKLKIIKRKAEFFFYSENTKIYKIFSPISFQEIKMNNQARKNRRFKKVKNSFKQKSQNRKTK